MKHLSCLVAWLLCAVCAQSQNGNDASYEMRSLQEKLREIQKGAIVTFGPGQFNSAPVSIGFPFQYRGKLYSTLYVTSNGSLHFGEPGAEVSPIAPVVHDASPEKIEYLLEGSAPNRVFTIEWEQITLKEGSAVPDLFAQVRLHERTGAIDFVYGYANRKIESPTQSTGTTINGLGPEGDIRLSTVYTKNGIVVSFQYLKLSEVITLDKKSLVFRFQPATSGDQQNDISDES